MSNNSAARDNIHKVFAYIRVSTETQSEKGYGMEDQQNGVLQLIKEKNYELIGEPFVDAGHSGAKDNIAADALEDALLEREGLLDMLDRLGEVDAIVVLNTSRLWRDDAPKFFIQRALKRRQVDIVSVEQPSYTLYDDSPNNKFLNTIMEAVDVLDRDSIRLKLARGRSTKASHGDKPAGVTPYGYQYAPDRKSIVVDPDEAAIIKLIFRLAQSGDSLQKIVNTLMATGYRTRRGFDWSKAGLHAICTNDFYTGIVTHKKKKIKGNHTALISKIQFGKVQAQLHKRRKITV